MTGASAGIGRATAKQFAERGATVALLARGERGLDGARTEVEALGGTAGVYPVDTADAHAVEKAAAQIEEELGEIDVWVNVAFTSVFARFVDIEPDEFERVTQVDLPRLRQRHARRAAADAAARSRHDRAGRLGARLSRHPAAERLLRRQARDPGLPRVAAHRAHARRQQRPRHDGADAGGQHSAVRLGAVTAAQPGATRAADLPAGGCRARRAVYAADHPRRREYWVGESTAGTLLANAVAPGLLDRYLARTGFKAQQTSQPKSADQPANLWEPADGADGRDFGAHGLFDDRSHGRSPQVWASQHHGAMFAGGLALVAGAIAAVVRAVRQ